MGTINKTHFLKGNPRFLPCFPSLEVKQAFAQICKNLGRFPDIIGKIPGSLSHRPKRELLATQAEGFQFEFGSQPGTKLFFTKLESAK